VLYGYATANKRYVGNELAFDANDPSKDGSGQKMVLHTILLSASVEAPTGTGLGVALPFGFLWRQDKVQLEAGQSVADKGLADVELRLRQDIGRFLGLRDLRVALTAGAVAPTGKYTVNVDALSLGRNVWWALAEVDVGYDLSPRWGASLAGGWRTPFGVTSGTTSFSGETTGQVTWGSEGRANLGVHYAQPVTGPKWLPSRVVAALSVDYQYRGRATELKNDPGRDDPLYQYPLDVGGHFLFATPSLTAALTDTLYLSATVRVPVWRDAYARPEQGQLAPNTAVFASLGGSFGGAGKSAQLFDPALGPKPGDKPSQPEVEKLVMLGKWTIVDYWATWCEPCGRLGQELEAYTAVHPDVIVRRMDASDWDSQQWRRMLPDAAGLPVLDVFSPDGVLRARLIGEKAFEYKALLPKDKVAP
jgi:thiol-disulfide isomerase/thioredoxin